MNETITYERNVTRERGLENLSKLADVVERVDNSKFDYRSFVGNDWKGEGATALECGTTACAYGWATAIPEFGLVLADAGCCGTVLPRELALDCDDGDDSDAGLEAGGKSVFALTVEEFDFLFLPAEKDMDENFEYVDEAAECNSAGLPTCTASAKTVAEHIRKFVAAGGIYAKGAVQ